MGWCCRGAVGEEPLIRWGCAQHAGNERLASAQQLRNALAVQRRGVQCTFAQSRRKTEKRPAGAALVDQRSRRLMPQGF